MWTTIKNNIFSINYFIEKGVNQKKIIFNKIKYKKVYFILKII